MMVAAGVCKPQRFALGGKHVARGAADLGLGRPSPGRPGQNDEKDRLVLVRLEVEGLDGSQIVSATCGDTHSAAVTENGALYTWGARLFMQEKTHVLTGLGHDDLLNKLVPPLVVPLHHLDARVGRRLPLPTLHALAFAMSTH